MKKLSSIKWMIPSSTTSLIYINGYFKSKSFRVGTPLSLVKKEYQSLFLPNSLWPIMHELEKVKSEIKRKKVKEILRAEIKLIRSYNQSFTSNFNCQMFNKSTRLSFYTVIGKLVNLTMFLQNFSESMKKLEKIEINCYEEFVLCVTQREESFFGA